MDVQTYKNKSQDDCVEAEIVSGPGSDGHTAHGRERRKKAYGSPGPKPVNIPFYGLFLRLKFLFITAIMLVSFTLIILGMILTSTVIGAIIGIPLLLIGGFLIWLLFKLLTLGQKPNPVVFRRL